MYDLTEYPFYDEYSTLIWYVFVTVYRYILNHKLGHKWLLAVMLQFLTRGHCWSHLTHTSEKCWKTRAVSEITPYRHYLNLNLYNPTMHRNNISMKLKFKINLFCWYYQLQLIVWWLRSLFEISSENLEETHLRLLDFFSGGTSQKIDTLGKLTLTLSNNGISVKETQRH